MEEKQYSKERSFGCLFVNGQTYFLNKDHLYIAKRGVFPERDEYIKDQKSIECIQQMIRQRIDKIYESTGRLYKRRKTVKGGNVEDLQTRFIIPSSDINYYDYEKFIYDFAAIRRDLSIDTSKRTFNTTRDLDEVFAVILCFFNIDNFDVSNFSEILTENHYEIGNLKGSGEFLIQNDQDTIDLDNLEKIKKSWTSGQEKLNPVNIDVEYEYESRSGNFARKYFLSDGNHRITALKLAGYKGLVPAIVCDYLPAVILPNCDTNDL